MRAIELATLVSAIALFTTGCQRSQTCVPGQQVACACKNGGSSVQVCLPAGTSFGICDCSLSKEAIVAPVQTGEYACDATGSFEIALKWTTKECYWPLEKAHFKVSPGRKGYDVADLSDGETDTATIKVQPRKGPCAYELRQIIDPEGAIAGSKMTKEDRYLYNLSEKGGVLTGTGTVEHFEFGDEDKPSCKAKFVLSGIHRV